MFKPLVTISILSLCASLLASAQEEKPFGDKFPNLDGMATGKWWEKSAAKDAPKKGKRPKQIVNMDVPRDQVVAFALYTHQGGDFETQCAVVSAETGRAARSETGVESWWRVERSRPSKR